MLFAIFSLSGVAALMYEALWVRQFTLVLGASSYAVTTILASYMAGLALGAFWIGRRADRANENRLARWYVGLEAGIGFYALLIPVLLDGAMKLFLPFCIRFQPGPGAFNALRIGFSFCLLLVPTMLMGGTLPVLARYAIRTRPAIAPTISKLYGVNTLGALVGVVITGYFLLPVFGTRLTNMLAAGFNFLVAALFWRLHVQLRTDPREIVAHRPADRSTLTLLQTAALGVFALSGAAAMIYQVAWTRTLSLILGTTTYAFTTIVAMYLLGIALGSLVYAWLRRWARAATLLSVLQLAIAATGLLSLPLFAKLPFLFLSAQQDWIANWTGLQFVRSGLAGMMILLPTLAMGAMLPAVAEIVIDDVDVLGRRLGRACAMNTVGAVVGTVAAGLLLIPTIGLQATILLAAFLNLASAAGFNLLRADGGFAKRLTQSAIAIVCFTILILKVSPWNPQIMSSGVYAYGDRYLEVVERANQSTDEDSENPDSWKLWREAMRQFKVLFYRSGPADTVAVMENPEGVRFLSVDGKTDASTSLAHDMKTQVMLGQLPLLAHPQARSVFLVGLGSGVTAGSVLTHPLDQLTCAEFSPAVIQAAHFFDEANQHALDDPRFHLLLRDARNALLTTAECFDVIIAQPSNPWISGQSSLFSLEWYQTVKAHLRPDGIFAQWLPAYAIDPRSLRVLIHTLRAVFPAVTVWSSGAAGDVIFLAPRQGSLGIDLAAATQRLRRKPVRADLARLGFAPDAFPDRFFLMGPEGLGEYLDRGRQPIPLNTDDRLVTEFSSPRSMFEQRTAPRFAQQDRLRQSHLDELVPLVHRDESGN